MAVAFPEQWCVSRSSVRKVYIDLTDLLGSETLTGLSSTVESGPAVTTASDTVLVAAATPGDDEIQYGGAGGEIAIGKGGTLIATCPDSAGVAVIRVTATTATQTIIRDCKLEVA